jgi:hypothetical protein
MLFRSFDMIERGMVDEVEWRPLTDRIKGLCLGQLVCCISRFI